MSSRQRGLRFLSLGVIFALALALLAACADDRPPETIVNTTIGQSQDRSAETTEETTEAEPEVPEEAETPEEATEEEATVTEEEEAEEPAGLDEEATKELFISASCGGCHTLSAAGAAGQVGPSLDGTDLEVGAVEQQIRKGGGSMPPFEGRLSDEEITALSEFVSENSK